MRFIVKWFEDAGCKIKHEKVFRDPVEAEACADYLRALPAGEVFRVTLTTEKQP